MSPFLGIHPIFHVAQSTGIADDDLSGVLLVALCVAGGAGLGLVFVGLRAWLARRRSAAVQPLPRAPSDPDATRRFRLLARAPARPPPPAWLLERAPQGGAGEAWLQGYLAKLRVVLPGLKSEGPDPRGEVPRLTRWVEADGKQRQSATSPDATIKIDATILSRIVKDVDMIQSEPATLIMADREDLCPDSTVKTRAVPAASDEDERLENFQYGARRS